MMPVGEAMINPHGRKEGVITDSHMRLKKKREIVWAETKKKKKEWKQQPHCTEVSGEPCEITLNRLQVD